MPIFFLWSHSTFWGRLLHSHLHQLLDRHLPRHHSHDGCVVLCRIAHFGVLRASLALFGLSPSAKSDPFLITRFGFVFFSR